MRIDFLDLFNGLIIANINSNIATSITIHSLPIVDNLTDFSVWVLLSKTIRNLLLGGFVGNSYAALALNCIVAEGSVNKSELFGSIVAK